MQKDVAYIQLSIDDTADILRELTVRSYASIFEEERLAFLKGLHEEYGATVSLYAFYQGENGFALSGVPTRYKAEWRANANWLRLGAHSTHKKSSFAGEDGVAEYERIYQEFMRFAGKECIDPCFRPHFFVIAPAVLRTLREKDLASGVHCPDDERACHSFTAEEEQTLAAEGYLCKEGIAYIKTQTRLENLSEETFDNFLAGLNGKKFVSVFTHESCLAYEVILKRLQAVCAYAKGRGFVFAFPADVL